MNHSPTVLEISRDALEHNYRFFRSKISATTKLMAVVKAGAYGSEATSVAKFLSKFGVDYFAVAYCDEGIALREAGIEKPILVLHPQADNLKLLITYRLEPNLYSLRVLNKFVEAADLESVKDYPVHLKLNTGLNRLGFNRESLETIHNLLAGKKSVHVKGLFSHLIASEDYELKDLSSKQILDFKDFVRAFEKMWGYRPMCHMSNTSGVLNYPEAHFDMVRIGLGLYGFANEESHTRQLKNVFHLKSIISQIHSLEKGDSVGYNVGFRASTDMRTATLPIGHADGIFRSLGQEKIHVSINGQKASVIGNICMDMIMVDVTGIDCQEGDEVYLFRDQEDILNMAREANTISYEILTALGPRIRRVLI